MVLGRMILTENKYYLSPICTHRLGDALISISNMYATLERSGGASVVYYHHWPKYFKKLWPHIKHPCCDIRFEALSVPAHLEIDENLEQKFKPLLLKAIKRSDFNFHPSQAYSKHICKLHPFINQELERLSIPECNIITNSTELGTGNKYVEFIVPKTESDLITYQGQSVDLNKNVRFALDINSEVKKFASKKFVDVSNPEIEFNEMLQFIASAKMHVGIDSAPMHIALAMGKEVVMLWDSVEGEKSLQWVYHLYKNYHEQIWLKKIGDDSGLTKFAQSNRGEKLAAG